MDAKEVIVKLENYTYNKTRVAEAMRQLEEITIKTTPTYGNLAPANSNGFNSKVENVGNRRLELMKKIREHQQKVAEVQRMIGKSGLTKLEKDVMWWIANNGKLAAYARRERIGKDNIYKIRDRAVKKIVAAHIPQNV